MHFWTIQSKNVIQIAKRNDVYYPDFQLSSDLHINDYQRVLKAFNNLNGTEYRGLVFCLAPELFQNSDNQFGDVNVVRELFRENEFIRHSLEDEPYSLFDKEHLLVKIVEPVFEKINTVPIDYWNHLMIMDGGSPGSFDLQKLFSDYRDLDYNEFEQLVIESIEYGMYLRPIMPTTMQKRYNTMTEIHIPYIRYSSIVESYEASSL